MRLPVIAAAALFAATPFVHGCSSVPTAAEPVPPASIEVAPGSIVLGAQPGDPLPPESATVRVRNGGTAPLRLDGATFVPGPAAGFTITAPSAFPITLLAGEEVELALGFVPADAASAPAALAIDSDDASAPRVEVGITTGSAPRPQLACAPSVLTLAQTPGTPASRAVRCTNTGTVSAVNVTLAVEGPGLEVALFDGPLTLAPGEWTEPFLVTWTPAAMGEVDGVVRLTSDLSDAAIAVNGLGTATPPCAHRADSFVQPGPPVDVLAVIDDSASMNDDLGTAVSAVYGLAERLADRGASFHLGVTTTDVYNGSYSENGRLVGSPRVIDADTPDLLQTVFENASVGLSFSDGVDTEGLRAVEMALGPTLLAGANAGFLRDGSALHVIFLADGNDDSPYDPLYYETFLRALQDGDPGRIAAHAVVGPCATAAEAGTRYQTLASRLGGATAAICGEDPGAALLTIADFAGRDRFDLATVPLPASIRVRAGGVTLPYSAWSIAGERVRLAAIPAPGETVTVDYDFGCEE